MNNLRAAIQKFYEVAIELSEAISNADADMLVASDYPFEKSFDEVVSDIDNWTRTVKSLATIAQLQANDVVSITIYDSATGKAQVLDNNPQSETIRIKWLEEPSLCYSCQSTIPAGTEWELKYDDVYEAVKFWSEEQIAEAIDDSNVICDKANMPKLINYTQEELKKGLDIDAAIDKASDRIIAEDDPCTRLDKSMKVY